MQPYSDVTGYLIAANPVGWYLTYLQCRSINFRRQFRLDLEFFCPTFPTCKSFILSFQLQETCSVYEYHPSPLHAELEAFALLIGALNDFWILILIHSSQELTQLPQYQCWLDGVEAYCIIREGCQIQETHTSRPSCQNYSRKHLSKGNKFYCSKANINSSSALLSLGVDIITYQSVDITLIDNIFKLSINILTYLASSEHLLVAESQMCCFSLFHFIENWMLLLDITMGSVKLWRGLWHHNWQYNRPINHINSSYVRINDNWLTC